MDKLSQALKKPVLVAHTKPHGEYTSVEDDDGFNRDSPMDRQITPNRDESPDSPKRLQSMVAQKKAELKLLLAAAALDCPIYEAIVHNASEAEDIDMDCWGAFVFVIVVDFPDLRAGRATTETRVRTAFVGILFLVNLCIQGTLLWYIGKLLMLPATMDAQDLYKSFHAVAFAHGLMDQEMFDSMSESEQDKLCGMALSQGLFCRVILFLWVTTNIGELRDNFAKTVGALMLPRLPDGTDTRLMVRDLPDTVGCEFCVVCLNLKGKVGLLVLVYLPKFTIAILLVLMGCLWLISAESIGDLILNSLALAFVVKVDELLAQVFFPARFQTDLSNLCMMLPADPEDKDLDKLSQKAVSEFAECAVVVISSVVLVEVMLLFQPVLPYFTDDVSKPCVEYLAQHVPWCLPWQSECFPTA